MKLKLKIVTPERILFDEEIDSVSLPTCQGEITVLPHHIPLVSVLAPGEIVLRQDNKVTSLAMSGGLVEVQPESSVIVLADTAERVEEIDVARAEEAKKRAAKLMSEKRHEAETFATLAAKMEKELARLRVARKHRSRQSLDIHSEG